MDLSLQPKLLRFLETRAARRVGSESEYRSKARILAATNRDLRTESRAEKFRSDLYFRLAEITILIPPLRDRPDDIPLLAMAFLDLANERFGKHFTAVEPELLHRMRTHSWSGNARELKSVIDRLVLLYDGVVLRSQWWDAPAPEIREAVAAESALPAGAVAALRIPSRKEKLQLAKRLLAESNQDLTWVAAQLGIHSSTLWRWRKAGQI